ncbi:MAG: hypothetical protein H7839_13940 [Magnetococcus sp. YQC-5]
MQKPLTGEIHVRENRMRASEGRGGNTSDPYSEARRNLFSRLTALFQ